MLEFIVTVDPATTEGRVQARGIFDLMDAGWPIRVVEPRAEIALAEPRSMLADLGPAIEGPDGPFDLAPDEAPPDPSPPSAGPSTADPGADLALPLAHREGPTQADDESDEVAAAAERQAAE